ncbi:hypothetical protein, conserved, partial [Eimeria maxima]
MYSPHRGGWRLPLVLLSVLLLLSQQQQQLQAAASAAAPSEVWDPNNTGSAVTDKVLPGQEGIVSSNGGDTTDPSAGMRGEVNKESAGDEAAGSPSVENAAGAAGGEESPKTVQGDQDLTARMSQRMLTRQRYRELLFNIGDEPSQASSTTTNKQPSRGGLLGSQKNRRLMGMAILGTIALYALLSTPHYLRRRSILRQLTLIEPLEIESINLAKSLGTDESYIAADAIRNSLKEARECREEVLKLQKSRSFPSWASSRERELLNKIGKSVLEATRSLRAMDSESRAAMKKQCEHMPTISADWVKEASPHFAGLVGSEYADALQVLTKSLHNESLEMHKLASHIMAQSKEVHPFNTPNDASSFIQNSLQLQYTMALTQGILSNNRTVDKLKNDSLPSLKRMLAMNIELYVESVYMQREKIKAFTTHVEESMRAQQSRSMDAWRTVLEIQKILKAVQNRYHQLQDAVGDLAKAGTVDEIVTVGAWAANTYKRLNTSLELCEKKLKALPIPPVLAVLQEQLTSLAHTCVDSAKYPVLGVQEAVSRAKSLVKRGVESDIGLRTSGSRPFLCKTTVNGLLSTLAATEELATKSLSEGAMAARAIKQEQNVQGVVDAATRAINEVTKVMDARCTVQQVIMKVELLNEMEKNMAESANSIPLFSIQTGRDSLESKAANEELWQEANRLRNLLDMESAFAEEAASVLDVATAAGRMRQLNRQVISAAYAAAGGIVTQAAAAPIPEPPRKEALSPRRLRRAKTKEESLPEALAPGEEPPTLLPLTGGSPTPPYAETSGDVGADPASADSPAAGEQETSPVPVPLAEPQGTEHGDGATGSVDEGREPRVDEDSSDKVKPPSVAAAPKSLVQETEPAATAASGVEAERLLGQPVVGDAESVAEGGADADGANSGALAGDSTDADTEPAESDAHVTAPRAGAAEYSSEATDSGSTGADSSAEGAQQGEGGADSDAVTEESGEGEDGSDGEGVGSGHEGPEAEAAGKASGDGEAGSGVGGEGSGAGAVGSDGEATKSDDETGGSGEEEAESAEEESVVSKEGRGSDDGSGDPGAGAGASPAGAGGSGGEGTDSGSTGADSSAEGVQQGEGGADSDAVTKESGDGRDGSDGEGVGSGHEGPEAEAAGKATGDGEPGSDVGGEGSGAGATGSDGGAAESDDETDGSGDEDAEPAAEEGVGSNGERGPDDGSQDPGAGAGASPGGAGGSGGEGTDTGSTGADSGAEGEQQDAGGADSDAVTEASGEGKDGSDGKGAGSVDGGEGEA